MEEFENPIIDEENIRESRKNKFMMLTIIILGTLLIAKFKEKAIFVFFITLPITFLSFFISLWVIVIRFSDSMESLDQSEIDKLEKTNPNIDYSQGNVKVLNKKGSRKLKKLGIIFLSYLILCGIAYIMMILCGF